jgi:hypothetical protein
VTSVALVAAMLSLPGVAHAGMGCTEKGDVEPTPRARDANERAIEAGKAGRYEEALALFQEAYDDSPSFVILYNIGKMAALTGDDARALRAYECHLESGDGAIEPERRADVEQAMAALRVKVATLAIEVDVAGLHVEVDGVDVGTTPLSDLVFVNPGKHAVRVRGEVVEEQSIEVARGARAIVRFRVKKGEGGPVEVPTAEPFRFPNGLVGAAWVTTGISTIAALVTGTVTIVSHEDLKDDPYLGPSRTPPEGSELEDKISRTRALAATTDVLIGLSALAGAAAITFSIVNATTPPTEPGPRQPKAAITVGPAWIGLQGEF